MAGGCRVENNHVPVILGGVVNEQIEGGDLLGAGRVQLLLHHGDGLGAAATGVGVGENARLVGRAGSLRVDLRHREVGHARHQGDCVAHRHTQHIAQVRRRVGGEQQGAEPLASQPDRRDARGDGFAHAALTSEEDCAPPGVGQQARQNGGEVVV